MVFNVGYVLGHRNREAG